MSPSDGARMLAEAKRLVPRIQALAADIERTRRMPEELIEAYHRAGFFHMWYPAALGGPQLSAVAYMRIVEALSYADGSAGWCAGLGAAYSRFAGYLPEDCTREIFPGNVLAGSLAPRGRGVQVAGGYQVSGRWNWGSGISHSQWAIITFLVEGAGLRIGFVPITGGVSVIDTWNVVGLRGTGSHDFAVDDLFVPEAYTLDSLDPPPRQPGGLYRIPLSTLYPFVIAATPLGIARAALDTFVGLAQDKVPISWTVTLRDKPTVQALIGRLAALMESARAFFYATAETLDLWAGTDEPLPMTLRVQARLACAQIGEAAKQVVRGLQEAAGGSAVYQDCLLERQFRDVHAAAQHVQVHPNNFEYAGRVILGLDPGTPRF